MLQLSQNNSQEKKVGNGEILDDISFVTSLFKEIYQSFVPCAGEIWQIFLKQVIK